MRDVLVTDTAAPFEWTIPTDELARVLEALHSRTPTTLEFRHDWWTVARMAAGVRLIGVHRRECCVDLTLRDVEALIEVTERLLHSDSAV